MKKVIIYADGSSIGNPGPGGWCGILMYNGKKKIISGGEPYSTNNQMELTAVIKSLEALKEPCEVDLYTDSEHVVKGLKEWLDNWAKNGWKTSKKKELKNVELWQKLDRLRKVHKINPIWIKGHSGDPLNEECDKIAKKEAEKWK
ncbi:MAG: ribonuclease HI [Hydrogenothermaceae bacterium]|nr:ribonuclease HI [Hydrogenothermaceae bacterium]